MAERATVVNLGHEKMILLGEPILDTQEGILIVAFDDGTSRTFNFDKVIDYYYLTEEETEKMIEEMP